MRRFSFAEERVLGKRSATAGSRSFLVSRLKLRRAGSQVRVSVDCPSGEGRSRQDTGLDDGPELFLPLAVRLWVLSVPKRLRGHLERLLR